jgi:hypothetical protein
MPVAFRALHKLRPIFRLHNDRAAKTNSARFGPPVCRRCFCGPPHVARVSAEEMLQHVSPVQVRPAVHAIHSSRVLEKEVSEKAPSIGTSPEKVPVWSSRTAFRSAHMPRFVARLPDMVGRTPGFADVFLNRGCRMEVGYGVLVLVMTIFTLLIFRAPAGS